MIILTREYVNATAIEQRPLLFMDVKKNTLLAKLFQTLMNRVIYPKTNPFLQ